jgi:hypothetical protein
MPNKCSICGRDDYREVMELLKGGQSVNSVSVRYKIPYDSLRRCFKEHCVLDQHSMVMQDLKKSERQLAKLEKTAISPGDIQVKRLRDHIVSLRSELRTLEAARKDSAEFSAETGAITIRALDQMVADYEQRLREIEPTIEGVNRVLRRVKPEILTGLCMAVVQFIKDFTKPVEMLPSVEPESVSEPALPAPPTPEEIEFLQCPHCQARTIVTTNGHLHCTACGQQEELTGGIRLKPSFPMNWVQRELKEIKLGTT